MDNSKIVVGQTPLLIGFTSKEMEHGMTKNVGNSIIAILSGIVTRH